MDFDLLCLTASGIFDNKPRMLPSKKAMACLLMAFKEALGYSPDYNTVGLLGETFDTVMLFFSYGDSSGD